ncbi:hypothetical protein [Thermosediminibacter oceani]|nr:hypothetical protein [Thermosediminibacter oceani]
MNTFSSFPIIIGNPINRSLNLIYKDFVNSAFPEIMKTAKEGDEIIVKTHLIPHKFIKKLPGNPKIKEIKASMLTIIINISLAAISFIIRKYVYKLNKGNLLEYLRKLNKHRYYVVIWKKVKK